MVIIFQVYINILEKVQKNMADEILTRLDKELEDDTQNIAVSIFLVVVVIIMYPLTLRAIWSLTTVLQNYARILASHTRVTTTSLLKDEIRVIYDIIASQSEENPYNNLFFIKCKYSFNNNRGALSVMHH